MATVADLPRRDEPGVSVDGSPAYRRVMMGVSAVQPARIARTGGVQLGWAGVSRSRIRRFGAERFGLDNYHQSNP